MLEEGPCVEVRGGVSACDSGVAGHVSPDDDDTRSFQPLREDWRNVLERRTTELGLGPCEAVEGKITDSVSKLSSLKGWTRKRETQSETNNS